MLRLTLIATLCVCVLSSGLTFAAEATKETKKQETLPAALDVEMAKLGEKKKINLAKQYKNKVVLLVNVASRCGKTPQYRALQKLHDKYAEKGLAIVGVPCNQFGAQEPGSAAEIASFCQKNYGVKFDILEKSKVKSSKPGQCPLYKHLTDKKTNPKFAGDIRWNFTKFLYSKSGEVIARFEPGVKPDDKQVVAAIEKALEEKK